MQEPTKELIEEAAGYAATVSKNETYREYLAAAYIAGRQSSFEKEAGNERYKKALEDLKKHLEIVLDKSTLPYSTTYHLVTRALNP